MKCNDWDNVKKLLRIQDKEEVCHIWTEYCLKWYSGKANLNKKRFYIFSIISIVCPLANTVEIVWFDCDRIAVVLSAIAALSSALLALFNASDKWNNYRSTAEFIKNEYMLYQAYASPYDNEEDRDEIYLKTIGDFMQKIHKRWQEFFGQSANQEQEYKPFEKKKQY